MTNTHSTPKDLVTREEAAAILGVTPRSVSRYKAAGRLGFYTNGKRGVRYSAKEVRDFLRRETEAEQFRPTSSPEAAAEAIRAESGPPASVSVPSPRGRW